MEAILKQILDGQNKLFQEVVGLKSEMVTLKDGQQQLFAEVAKTNARLDDMPTKADLEKTIMEQQKDVMALLERTATKDAVVKVDTKIDLINNKLFQTETEIALLKLVK